MTANRVASGPRLVSRRGVAMTRAAETGTADEAVRVAAVTMNAIVQAVYVGDPQSVVRIAAAPNPPLGDNDLLVRVHAASVDRGSWHLMAGLPYPIRLAMSG